MPFLTIRFINSTGFISSAIDYVEGGAGEFDHTECLDVATNEWIGAHDDGGFQRRPYDYVKPSNERRYAIPCTEDEYVKGMTWLNSKIGTPYDFTDILGILFHRNKFDPHRLICSWAMFNYISAAFELRLPRDRYPLNVAPENAHRVTPETLHLSSMFIGRSIANNAS